MKLIQTRFFNQISPKLGGPGFTLRRFFLALPLLLSAFAPISAQPLESLEEIRLAAKIFLEEKQISADKENTEVIIGQIDSRLQLAKCDDGIELFLPQTAKYTGKTTVGIRCAGPIAWKIYVSAEVTNFQAGWVVNRNLLPGEILTQNDISHQRVKISNSKMLPMSDLQQVLNTSPKRRMRTGSTIYHGSVCLVCRGDKVMVSAANQFLSINVEGVALSDAVLGERIQVQNTKSKKVFDAIVTGKSQLNVNITGSN